MLVNGDNNLQNGVTMYEIFYANKYYGHACHHSSEITNLSIHQLIYLINEGSKTFIIASDQSEDP